MVLRLHVWGPAFGLASLDADCLATITYFAFAVPAAAWELVVTSPSAVPTHTLPALHDTQADAWTTGFSPITTHLRTLNPAWDLDVDLSPSQRADATAYAAFLTSTAAPLLALSLYVSSDNWAATTRPAYSNVLPFPLTWTEPPAVRRRMCHVAAHLGLSDLNMDESISANANSDTDSRGFLKVPERLRPRNRSVKAALSPEQTSLFRLEAAGRECLGVLADLKTQQQTTNGSSDEHGQDHLASLSASTFFFSSGSNSSSSNNNKPTSIDCLAFGYLALMLVPEVPRPWLRDLLRNHYECLCLFVDSVRDHVFGGDVAASLPWRQQSTSTDDASSPRSLSYEPYRVVRFARGLLHAALPRDWFVQTTTPSSSSSSSSSSKPIQLSRKATAMLTSLGSSAAALGLVGGVLLYRHLSPFGALVYRWELQRRSFGAAGAFFGI